MDHGATLCCRLRPLSSDLGPWSVIERTLLADRETSLERPYTVAFDGPCRICSRMVAVLQKLDRGSQLEVVPSQANGVMARFPWIPPHSFADALQLIGRGGRTWQRSAAIERILQILPKGKLV